MYYADMGKIVLDFLDPWLSRYLSLNVEQQEKIVDFFSQF